MSSESGTQSSHITSRMSPVRAPRKRAPKGLDPRWKDLAFREFVPPSIPAFSLTRSFSRKFSMGLIKTSLRHDGQTYSGRWCRNSMWGLCTCKLELLCRFGLCRAASAGQPGQVTLSGGRGPGTVAGGPPSVVASRVYRSAERIHHHFLAHYTGHRAGSLLA